MLTFLVLLPLHFATLHRYLVVLLRCRRGGVGGNMLTFLVLLPLHVATLHRCLVVLLRCIYEGAGWWGHVNVPCTSSATWCYAAQMSGSVASLYT